MIDTKLKLPDGNVVVCEVLDRYKNVYEVRYHDPKTETVWQHWTDVSSIIFPQYSELVV